MKQTSEQNPSKGKPPFSKSERVQDPKETAQEAIHQVMPKDAAKDAIKKEEANRPLHAAKGNDEVMSQQPRNQR